jgi:hypothetical protein
LDLLHALLAYEKVLADWIIKTAALNNLTPAQQAQRDDILKERTRVLDAIDALNAAQISVAANQAQVATASVQQITAGLDHVQGTIAEAQVVLVAANRVAGILTSLFGAAAFVGV